MKTEQIQQIVDGAINSSTHVELDFCEVECYQRRNYEHEYDTHNIHDLKEILALRKERDELKRKNHCQSEQLNQFATENEAEKRRADGLAAYVERIRDAGSMLEMLDMANQTPTQSLEALKLEQQAKIAEEAFYQGYSDGCYCSFVDVLEQENESQAAAKRYADYLRNQVKEQE